MLFRSADAEDLSILTALGEVYEQDNGQLELELLSGEAKGDAMLAELDDGSESGEAEAAEEVEDELL